jgi:hypothetical protein
MCQGSFESCAPANRLTLFMRPAGILLCKLGFSRELDHTAISQTFAAEVANHNGALLLSLNTYLRDELLYPMQPGRATRPWRKRTGLLR